MPLAASLFGDLTSAESQKVRHLYTTSGWNTIVRAAGQRAGVRFLEAYIPLRWNRMYATGKLHYTKGGRVPFYKTGDWIRAAEAGANVQTTATKGNAVVRLRIPTGHPIKDYMAAGFKTITPNEIVFVRAEFKKALIESINTTPVIKPGRLNGRARAQVAADLATASKGRARSLIFAQKTTLIRSKAP